jgi:WD40 repeat protein
VGAVERTWRWCRRYPVVTALLVLLALFGGVMFYLFGRANTLQRNEAEARQAADEALADLTVEKRQTTDLLYATRINLSHREWQAGNASRARQLLEDCPQALRGWEWDFLKGLFDERSLVLHGHAGHVLGVALTPDGRRAVTFGNEKDGTVRVWDTRTGASPHQLKLTAHGLAVSPDGARAAVAVGNSVQVFELATGRTVYSVDLGALPLGLGFVRDGADLAVALLGGEVRFLDAANGKERSRLGRRLAFALATRELLRIGQGVVFSPDGRWLGQGGTEGQLRVWDAQTGEQVLEETGHLIVVRQVAFSPDGRRLASPGGEGDIRVWDLQSKQPVLRLTGHRSMVHCVAFSPDGRRLISGSKDMTVRVWDLDTGDNVLTLTGHSSEVFAVAFAGGNRAASAALDSTARVWDVDERLVYGEAVRAFFQGENLLDPARRGIHDALTFLGYLGLVRDLAFGPDGQTLATVGQLTPTLHANPQQAPEVTIWDIKSRRELHRLSVPQERDHHLAYSPDGRLLVVGTGTGKRNEPAELDAFDPATGRRVWHCTGPPGLEVRPVFAPGGARLATQLKTATGDSFLVAWDARDGKEVFRQPLAGPHTRASYSPDGQVLVTAGAAAQGIVLEKYDAQTGRLQGSWPAGAASLMNVVCAPDGVVAAATTGDRPVIKLYRLADGHELGSLEGHVGAITALAFSPDGRRLLSCASDFTVRVWHTGSGRELLTFREHTDSPLAVAWSPDGWRIGSAGYDRMIKVWEARPAEVPPRTEDWPLTVHDDFAADGDLGPWQPLLKSPWEIRGGALHGQQVNVTFPGTTFPFAGAARSGANLPRTVEVRFAYRAERPLAMGVTLAAPDGQSGYTALLCGGTLPFGRPCTKLQRYTEGLKNIFYVGLERPFAMQPGHWHQVRVLRQPDRIRVHVDDSEVLTEAIPDLELPNLSLVGMFGAAGDEIEFKDVEVRAPAEARR